MTYSFEYDEFGNMISTSVGDDYLAYNFYGYNNGNLQETEYENGFLIEYEYDDYDRLQVINENNAMKYRYTYDNRGNIAKIEDFIVGRDEPLTTVYNYDLLNRLLVEEKNDGTYLEYNYDIMDRITRVDYFFNNILQTFTYSYGDDNQLGETTLPGGLTVDHFYDSIGLPESNEVTTEDGAVLQTEFDYNFLSGSRVTSQLYDYTTTASVDGENTELAFFRYEYDDNGNIISVQDADGYVTEYTYDEMNQLIRADDENRGVTTVYTYDEGGNITSVEEYAYTTGTPGEVNTTYSYVYGDEDWTDLLTSYNGQGITYDEIGNPLTYRGMNFTWAGRRLTKTEIGSDTISYTYNIDGIRTSKTVGTETTEYFLEGNTIIAQKTGNNVLWFLYDADGQRIGFTYNDTPYLYVYNATGDVVGIVDDTLTMVVEYTYSPWGEILSTTGDEADTIGVINPFRYRGYYYDEETGLYCLNSRYYDPETGRFINADTTDILTASPTSSGYDKNLYAYCDNDPISRTDSSGEFWHIVIGAAVGAVINVGCTIISNIASGGDWYDGVGLAALSGAASGALSCTGVGLSVMIAGNAAISAVTNTAEQYMENGNSFNNFDVGELAFETVWGGATSVLGGRPSGSKHLMKLGVQTVKRTVNTATHKGWKAGVKEAKKAAAYYIKNTRSRYSTFAKDTVKDFGIAISSEFSKNRVQATYERLFPA